ncbi:aminotransferase class I/II-fold pyridoxal phosphate-dependent enzyme [Streptomyces tricolor]|nr:aminotransferase class I/II-fold pyridoxal phosphate-dependent enzyme [Streptomyces tricolor]
MEAYGQLIAEGYLEALRGSGTWISQHLPPSAVPTLLDDGVVPDVRWDLRPGTIDGTAFPQREWLAAYQQALTGAGGRELGYPRCRGRPPCAPSWPATWAAPGACAPPPRQIMVTSGFAQVLSLLGAALPRLGIDALGMEDPCHHRQRQFVAEAGLRVRSVPVDEDGIDVDALARTGARAVLVTPAHQFPTGATLSTERRAALVRWAEDVDGFVVEDDYDGELWFDETPRPLALQRLCPDRVLYAGTASKSLSPALRLAWIAVPPRLTSLLEQTRARRDLGSEILTQLAFTELLASGGFDRHLRRRRARLRARRLLLERAVRNHLPDARILGAAAGLHAYVELPRHVDEPRLVAAALHRSVLVRGGAHFRHGTRPAPPALVIGCAAGPRRRPPGGRRGHRTGPRRPAERPPDHRTGPEAVPVPELTEHTASGQAAPPADRERGPLHPPATPARGTDRPGRRPTRAPARGGRHAHGRHRRRRPGRRGAAGAHRGPRRPAGGLRAGRAGVGGAGARLARRKAAEALTGCVSGSIVPFTCHDRLPVPAGPARFDEPTLYVNAARLDLSVALAAEDHRTPAGPKAVPVTEPRVAPPPCDTPLDKGSL